MVQEYPIKFGKYLLLERIAVGGMAEIFRAIFSTIEGVEKLVAIKRILPEYSVDEEFISLFVDEARISATLQHPSIVQVFDFGKIDRSYYLAMEYVDGPNLKSFVRRLCQYEQEFPIEYAIYIIIQILKALDYLYRATDSSNRPLRVIHRDISPQNILLSREAEVKITDFGIAKAASKLSQTVPGKIQGKFGYMSPEQAVGKELDHRSDLFSLGIIFFEMLTGKRLYGGENTFIRYENVKEAKIQAVSKFRDVPEALDRIVKKMLHKNPDERYQSSADLQKDLSDFLYPANVETVIASLAKAINKYFPKQVSDDKQPEQKPPAEKKRWWRKRSTKAAKEEKQLAKKSDTITSGQEALLRQQQDSKQQKSSQKDVDEITLRQKGRNVIELRSRRKEKDSQSKSFIGRQNVYFGRALTLVLVLVPLLLVGYFGVKMAGAKGQSFLGSLFHKGSVDKLEQEISALQNEKTTLDQQFADKLFELENITQQYLNLQEEKSQLESNLKVLETEIRRLEGLLSEEQNRWEKERGSLLAQVGSFKAQLAEATRKCPQGMIFVPASKFFFGSPTDDPERNLGEVNETLEQIKGFCVDQYEFPNARGQLPRVSVTWEEALSACEESGKRLCSEKEWERACKGNKNSRYSYGKSWQEGICNTEDQRGKDSAVAEVGNYKECKTDLGIFDMSGNVAEWTDKSGSAASTNPVVKGGAFDRAGYWSRCAARLVSPPSFKLPSVGFRCCKDVR